MGETLTLIESASWLKSSCEVHKTNCRKNKVVTGWQNSVLCDRSIMYSPHSIFILSLASDGSVLYGNVALSILVLSTKKYYSSFFKKGLCFSKNLFQSIENVQNFQWLLQKNMPIS